MILKLRGNVYTMEQKDKNIQKFVELTIWGVTPKYKKWYEAFKETEKGQEHWKRLMGIK